MTAKYFKGDIVYSYYFNLETRDLMCEKLLIQNHEYSDMIVEYVCQKEYFVKIFKFFKKKKKSLITLPEFLISDDQIVAKIKLFQFVLDNFGYINKETHYDPESAMINIVDYVKKEMKILIEKYPEKYLKVIDTKRPKNSNNYTIWR